jgi:hypothetical protein
MDGYRTYVAAIRRHIDAARRRLTDQMGVVEARMAVDGDPRLRDIAFHAGCAVAIVAEADALAASLADETDDDVVRAGVDDLRRMLSADLGAAVAAIEDAAA